MRKLTIAAATIAFGALLAPVQADDLRGGPIRVGNQCFNYAQGQGIKDSRFGSWSACPQTASASVAPAPTAQRRQTRNRSASR